MCVCRGTGGVTMAVRITSVGPERCTTKRCRGAPEMTYLGEPLCGHCWLRLCREWLARDLKAGRARALAAQEKAVCRAAAQEPETAVAAVIQVTKQT